MGSSLEAMNKMEFPDGKYFAFTIVDDTNNATMEKKIVRILARGED